MKTCSICRRAGYPAWAETVLYTDMAGGDLVAQVGVGKGTNLADLGPGQPSWWWPATCRRSPDLVAAGQAGRRAGCATDRANPADDQAGALRHPYDTLYYGEEAAPSWRWSIHFLPSAQNCPEGQQARCSPELGKLPKPSQLPKTHRHLRQRRSGLEGSQALAQACANLLIATNHVGKSITA